MTLLDLTNRGNWQILLSESKRVTRRKPTRPNKLYEYDPISPFFSSANSRTVLIGCYSESAEPHYYLGAKVSQYLYVSPSSNANFISGVQVSKQEKARLGQFTLIRFEDYNIYPYLLNIEIPYWLEDIYIEAWQYLDPLSENTDELLLNLQSEISEMRFQLDQLQNLISQ